MRYFFILLTASNRQRSSRDGFSDAHSFACCEPRYVPCDRTKFKANAGEANLAKQRGVSLPADDTSCYPSTFDRTSCNSASASSSVLSPKPPITTRDLSTSAFRHQSDQFVAPAVQHDFRVALFQRLQSALKYCRALLQCNNSMQYKPAIMQCNTALQ